MNSRHVVFDDDAGADLEGRECRIVSKVSYKSFSQSRMLYWSSSNITACLVQLTIWQAPFETVDGKRRSRLAVAFGVLRFAPT